MLAASSQPHRNAVYQVLVGSDDTQTAKFPFVGVRGVQDRGGQRETPPGSACSLPGAPPQASLPQYLQGGKGYFEREIKEIGLGPAFEYMLGWRLGIQTGNKNQRTLGHVRIAWGVSNID